MADPCNPCEPRGPRPPRPPSICHPPHPRPPTTWPRPPESPEWPLPPVWWLIKHGYILEPMAVGYPVKAEIRFRPNPNGRHLPRQPWPYESESRPAGTGLVMGRYPRRKHHHWRMVEEEEEE